MSLHTEQACPQGIAKLDLQNAALKVCLAELGRPLAQPEAAIAALQPAAAQRL